MAAYDGYRSQPDHHHHNQHSAYSSSYDPSYDPRAYQQQPPSYPKDSSYRDPARPPSRSSSRAPSDGTAQPLNAALNNAFDKSDSAQRVDPELIAQITAEVKKSVLDEIKMSGVHPGVTAQPQPAHAPQQYVPHSPSTSASFPSRNVYTPPSPKHPDYSSHGSESPDPLSHDPLFDGTDDTPTPRYERSAPVDIPQEKSRPRPPPPASSMPNDVEYSPIEKMWQPLFDLQGKPTPRLGQFLRGLAIHLIEDYEPKKSLVIPPSKMLKFYSDVKLPDEVYPWQKIFGEMGYSNLSKLYREMRCQHHFIQEHSAEQPIIPALTPEGFQEWMIVMIQAYPEEEYARLSRAVLDMPISNADDVKERFPKELPRRLLPVSGNLQAQQRCTAIFSAEQVGPLRRAPTFPPPPPMGQSTRAATNLERERSPYAGQPDSRVIDSEDEQDEPPSVQLERERKPYSAAPGGGKVYDDGMSRSMHSDTSIHEQRRRTQSTASQSQWAPPPNGAQYSHPATQANSRRPRSPSFSGYGTRSDPNVYDSEEDSRRFAKDAEMRRKDWARRHADDDPFPGGHHRRSTAGTDSSYESQPRSVYDDDYHKSRSGSNGYGGYDSRRY